MEKLSICFMIWALYADRKDDIYYDFDKVFSEAKERGFNCVRFDDGAGLICDTSGKERGLINYRPSFGKYTEYVRQSSAILHPIKIDITKRLLQIFASAKKYGIKLIPSSWYYLHTNWGTDEEINDELFSLPTEKKIEYFALELDRILTLARDNGYIDTIAFAEIFNEFDGLPFAGEYRDNLSKEENNHLRDCHEKAIDFLKSRHKDVLFAYDSANAYINPELLPRNIDILNCHIYYMWAVYQHYFECYCVTGSLEEIDYSEKTLKYLRADKTKVKDVVNEMGNIVRTGDSWPRRIALYSSIADEKMGELESMLTEALQNEQENYFKSFSNSVEKMIEVRDKYVKDAKLVMGEGITYCCSNYLLFEEHCDLYWSILMRQAKFLNEKGFYGSVIRTTSDPEDPSWTLRFDSTIKVNNEFLK